MLSKQIILAGAAMCVMIWNLDVALGGPPPHVQAFIDEHLETARRASAQWGIPTSVILGMSAWEVGWGTTIPGGRASNAWFNRLVGCDKVKDMSTVVRLSNNRCAIKHSSFEDAANAVARDICTSSSYVAAQNYARQFDDTKRPIGDFDVGTFLDKLSGPYAQNPAWGKSVLATIATGNLKRYDSEPLLVCPK